NKIDTQQRENLAHEFYSLGISDLFPVSAEHAIGMEALLDRVAADFREEGVEEATAKSRQIKVAIIGRPNTGKSTLLNSLTGEERAIVSPVAGTTRDAVDEAVEHNGIEDVCVDT